MGKDRKLSEREPFQYSHHNIVHVDLHWPDERSSSQPLDEDHDSTGGFSLAKLERPRIWLTNLSEVVKLSTKNKPDRRSQHLPGFPIC